MTDEKTRFNSRAVAYRKRRIDLKAFGGIIVSVDPGDTGDGVVLTQDERTASVPLPAEHPKNRHERRAAAAKARKSGGR